MMMMINKKKKKKGEMENMTMKLVCCPNSEEIGRATHPILQ